MTEKRQIGSVEQIEDQAHQQWATLGGTTTRKPPSAQLPGGSDAQVPGLLDTQVPRKPERKRQTVYLYPDLYKWIRHYATDTDQEISDVLNEALKQYKAAQETVKTE
jgi:hypothetical protein